ncbi:MAG: phage tail sheath subtilisin-like domain-containing protein [Bacteroidetes bacterium]|nr:phage tail sheath subtilisin-like domain-containing protein [Bacteroidota bacterium]
MSSEKIISAGVFTRENDQSFLPQGIGEIGAAVVGPTVKGRALVPTLVSSYAEFQELFGDTFDSGSDSYQYLTSMLAESYLKYGNNLLVTRILAGSYSAADSQIPKTGSLWTDAENVAASSSFTLYTLGDGAILNSTSSIGTNNLLSSGSKDNFQWEVSNVNSTKGTFTLLIRRGDDNIKRKVILEQWNNLNMDPKSSNYIEKRIGDQVYTLRDSGTTTPFLQLSGSYENKSKYVRVAINSTYQTPDYLDENGNIRNSDYSGSLPSPSSGSFANGSDGNVKHPQNFYENIANANTQGYDPNVAGSGSTAYLDALKILSNQLEYDFNLLLLPGIIDNQSNHEAVATKAVDVCEDRGDCFCILDPCIYGSSITDATTESGTRDTNYSAHYWPWVKIPDTQTGKNVWVPASIAAARAFTFNDKVGYPWYAPAGLNRGALDNVISAERKLTRGNLDDLYDANVNPVATFPREGVVIWGQKTLQKKASALDRINVRRLLIAAKKFIASTSRYLVFENATASLMNKFVNLVNPYFEDVASKQGLFAFKVVMDSTNNTSDTIDRNELHGAIYLQPSRTAEFLVIDFNILPTGAEFPS